MKLHHRREFIGDVARGMLIAGMGPTLAGELGLSTAFADQGPELLEFGALRPLVTLMQEKTPDKLQSELIGKLKSGSVSLRQLVAAASLANAETFGGEDYVGFHTEMALLPSLHLAKQLPEKEQPLPVLKVLYRNATRIQQYGGATKKTLRPIHGSTDSERGNGKILRRATRAADMAKAERLFSNISNISLEDAYNQLQYIVQDEMNVHRFVLAHRAWGLIDIVGNEHAHTLLRQSVRFCVKAERNRIDNNRPEPGIRRLLPKILDNHNLIGRKLGLRQPDDAWLDEMIHIIYNAGKERATDAVGAALAEGIAPEVVGEAISLAANQLSLRQRGGRTHGASQGVHGSDAINAWRNMVKVTNQRNTVCGLLVATYHTAEYSSNKDFKDAPFPHVAHLEQIKARDPEALLKATESAIRENNQSRAAAAIHLYGELGHPSKPVFALMLKNAISEDGRLHAEKYYHTVVEEFASTRPAYRWRQLVALARVTASAYGFTVDDRPGYRAPGYEDACRLLQA
ncbi:MAG TPA: hypothetical protein EYG38_05540 [Verrucomicrobia bacterium]|nr:hypothetical protein [Verrucomicrobiota bacterium]